MFDLRVCDCSKNSPVCVPELCAMCFKLKFSRLKFHYTGSAVCLTPLMQCSHVLMELCYKVISCDNALMRSTELN